jgi:hypothetical protein
LERLRSLASDLLTAVESADGALAAHLARELIAETPKVREEHRARLGVDGGRLEAAVGLVRAISEGIQAGKARGEMVQGAQRVSVEMSGLCGILRRNIEEATG